MALSIQKFWGSRAVPCVDTTRFLDLEHPWLQKWKADMLACRERTNATLLWFTSQAVALTQSMAYKVFADLNNVWWFDYIFVDISSRKYPDMQPVDLVTISNEWDLSKFIFAQIQEELFPDLVLRDAVSFPN